MKTKLQIIKEEKDNANEALENKHPYDEYETEAQLSAYSEGIEFVMSTLSDIKDSSLWRVTFPDGNTVDIKGTDIFSVIFELEKLGYPYEEAVTFDCLPE